MWINLWISPVIEIFDLLLDKVMSQHKPKGLLIGPEYYTGDNIILHLPLCVCLLVTPEGATATEG